MERVASHASFGGRQEFWKHASGVIGLEMRFSIYLPPRPRGLLLYLAGLTCTEETFPAKAGAQRVASELGLALLCPDTSPRGAGIAGEADSWSLGVGAGFYLDATREPWSRHWRMESYLVDELLPLARQRFALEGVATGITGHSMGGHGALTLALRHPGVFASVSALAPVSAPMHAPWGIDAFSAYLGEDREAWARHDATELLIDCKEPPFPGGILVDQGLDDKFLIEQLMPERLESACRHARQPITLRRHAGYDHSYYFVATFIADHLSFHSQAVAPV